MLKSKKRTELQNLVRDDEGASESDHLSYADVDAAIGTLSKENRNAANPTGLTKK